MSKQGRATIVLLASVTAALLLVPLVYLVLAQGLPLLDQDAVDANIAMLQEVTAADPGKLQALYSQENTQTLPILLPLLPPDPDFYIVQSGGVVVCDPEQFPWLDDLTPTNLYGVTVYPVTVTEDSQSLETLFLDGANNVVGSVAAEAGYDPYQWVEAAYPELFASYLSPQERDLNYLLYDPARYRIRYMLLSADDVQAMAEAMAEEAAGNGFFMELLMGEEPEGPVTNLVIFAIEKATNGMALGIAWPEDFTNRLEIFARSSPAPVGWSVISTNLLTAGLSSLWWVDDSLTSQDLQRFYRVGDAQQDSDSDGLTDARERLTWGSDEAAEDTDADGLDDYREVIELDTDPTNNDTNKPNIILRHPAHNGVWVWMP